MISMLELNTEILELPNLILATQNLLVDKLALKEVLNEESLRKSLISSFPFVSCMFCKR